MQTYASNHRASSLIVCAVVPPPRKPRIGGRDNSGGEEGPKSKFSSVYSQSATLTARKLVQDIVERWGKACRVGLVKKDGHVVMRVYLNQPVTLPRNFPMYEDICHRINTWNAALYVTHGISIAPSTRNREKLYSWLHIGLGSLLLCTALDMLRRGDRTEFYDIPLHVPTSGARMSEFHDSSTHDLAEN